MQQQITMVYTNLIVEVHTQQLLHATMVTVRLLAICLQVMVLPIIMLELWH